MVINTFIKCQVCKSVTRIRLQVGLQEEHPIVITCGKCGTSLSGIVKINQKECDVMFIFNNADEGIDAPADFVVECAGEFPTFKQVKASEWEKQKITPFFRMSNRMNRYDLLEQFTYAISVLNQTAKKWKDYKRILDLFQNNSEYLIQEIKKEFSGELFQCRDEFEILRAVHMIEVLGFYMALKREIIENKSFSNDILKFDKAQMKALIDFLNSHEGYSINKLQGHIFKIYGEFLDVFQRLIPALSLQYCKEDSYNFEDEGSTTSNFDMIKHFYLDVYEVLGNLLIIPIALNNIKYRSDINAMKTIRKDVSSLDDFINLTKAAKYQLCEEEEIYTGLLGIITDAKLRNAIGHNDVEYDAINQLIKYIPNSKNKSKKETKYLLEFENEAVHMFQAVLEISEYLYHLRKFSLMVDGKVPINQLEQINKHKKISRNEPYPCENDKKYKFCHDEN